jgi:hypothetical protein
MPFVKVFVSTSVTGKAGELVVNSPRQFTKSVEDKSV